MRAQHGDTIGLKREGVASTLHSTGPRPYKEPMPITLPMHGPILFLQPAPKPLCGVSDHTQMLIKALAALGVEGRRISLDELRGMPDGKLNHTRLFVQTSIYGFQHKGLPFALVREVERASRLGARVCGYFHETWVPSAPVMKSAFWLRPAQRLLCQWLATRFDRAHFNSPWSLAWGRTVLGDRARFSPTFSNVGELAVRRPLAERPARLVCFGSPSSRRAAYAALSAHLPALVAAGHVHELIDIGAGSSDVTSGIPQLPGLAVRILGSAAAGDISDTLADARYGLHFTPWALATKSGIYGALLAHGVMPISIYEDESAKALKLPKSAEQPALIISLSEWHRRLDAGAQLEDFQQMLNRATHSYKSVNDLALEIVADFAEPAPP